MKWKAIPVSYWHAHVKDPSAAGEIVFLAVSEMYWRLPMSKPDHSPQHVVQFCSLFREARRQQCPGKNNNGTTRRAFWRPQPSFAPSHWPFEAEPDWNAERKKKQCNILQKSHPLQPFNTSRLDSATLLPLAFLEESGHLERLTLEEYQMEH